MTQLIDISTKKYPNQFAIVDDEDYDRVMAMGKWTPAAISSRKTYVLTRRFNPISNRYETLYLHRFITNAQGRDWDVDHINGQWWDNRRCNLRICSRVQNMQNQQRRKELKTSKFKGVSRHSRNSSWCVFISVNKKRMYLGSFKSEVAAAIIYDKAALEHFGEFAMTNQMLGLFDDIGLEIE